MTLQLSIIVPVYNVEPYLEECLVSVVNQTLDDSRYEILLIDDKSTDGSLAICNDFATRHANIRVFPLPENTPGGAGFPSNFGILQAQGQYIGFVDSDDYASPGMFAELLATAGTVQPGGADLAICSFSVQYPDGTVSSPYDAGFWHGLFTPEFAALPLALQKERLLRIAPPPWRKLYKREFLRTKHVMFPVGDFFYEDTPFHWFTILQAESIALNEKPLVTHREERPGQTVSADRGDMAMQVAGHIGRIREFLLETNYYQPYRKAFLDFALSVTAFVPKDHPMRPRIVETVTRICSAPPETAFKSLLHQVESRHGALP